MVVKEYNKQKRVKFDDQFYVNNDTFYKNAWSKYKFWFLKKYKITDLFLNLLIIVHDNVKSVFLNENGKFEKKAV